MDARIFAEAARLAAASAEQAASLIEGREKAGADVDVDVAAAELRRAANALAEAADEADKAAEMTERAAVRPPSQLPVFAQPAAAPLPNAAPAQQVAVAQPASRLALAAAAFPLAAPAQQAAGAEELDIPCSGRSADVWRFARKAGIAEAVLHQRSGAGHCILCDSGKHWGYDCYRWLDAQPARVPHSRASGSSGENPPTRGALNAREFLEAIVRHQTRPATFKARWITYTSRWFGAAAQPGSPAYIAEVSIADDIGGGYWEGGLARSAAAAEELAAELAVAAVGAQASCSAATPRSLRRRG